MGDDLYQSVIQMLAARPGAKPGLNMRDLLPHLDTSDPRVAILAQYLAQRQDEAARPAPSPSDPDTGEEGSFQTQDEEPDRVSSQLRLRIAQADRELEQLREQNDRLAWGLGACYLCWGRDPACPVCGGAGRPGSTLPDRELFGQLVVPAVRRLYQSQGAENHFSGNNQPRVTGVQTPDERS